MDSNKEALLSKPKLNMRQPCQNTTVCALSPTNRLSPKDSWKTLD